MIRESQLISYCDQVIQRIKDEKEKRNLKDYIVSTKKYPCSLFIATWYLIRLGYIDSILLPETEVALNLINILPESFRPFEERGFEIIRNTPYSEALKNIENRYFE